MPLVSIGGVDYGVDLVGEVGLVVPEARRRGAILPPDERGDAGEPEPRVSPPRVRRVPPRRLVADVRAQQHHVLLLPLRRRLHPVVDHRLRHVAVCTRSNPPAAAAIRRSTGGIPEEKYHRGGLSCLPGHQVWLEEASRSARKRSSFTLPSASSPAAKSLSKWASKSATVASTFSTVMSALRLLAFLGGGGGGGGRGSRLIGDWGEKATSPRRVLSAPVITGERA